MTPEKVKQAFDACIKLIHEDGYMGDKLQPVRFDAMQVPSNEDHLLEHALWMCEEGKQLVDQNRIEKAMRWLGFVQGVMWSAMSITVDELKKVNMPESEVAQ